MMYSGLPTSRLSTRGPHVKDCVRHVGGQDGRHGGRHGGGQGDRHGFCHGGRHGGRPGQPAGQTRTP